jgi:hypothetical protein
MLSLRTDMECKAWSSIELGEKVSVEVWSTGDVGQGY